MVLSGIAASGCDVNSALEQIASARALCSDALTRFITATDAANRAVMAGTDEASVDSSQEAEKTLEEVQRDTDSLRPILERLGYRKEVRLLAEFEGRFAAYRTLDRTIRDMAVQNTNVKAQRLSFGPAEDAARSYRVALEALRPADEARDTWRVQALVAMAVLAVRDIQVAHATHIADGDDAAMTTMEQSMAQSEVQARATLAVLQPLVPTGSRAKLADAAEALDRFMMLNAQITALSRRNTNVRSLALSLTEKVKVSAACVESLTALRAALATRGFTGTR